MDSFSIHPQHPGRRLGRYPRPADRKRRSGADRSTVQIDSDYVDGGGTAYVAVLSFESNGELRLRLDSTGTTNGVAAGPEFTSSFEQNYILAIRVEGGTVYSWDGSILTDADATEPYIYPSASVASAGPANDSALRTALAAASAAQCILFNASDPRIDAANFRLLEAPDAPDDPAEDSTTEDSITFSSVAGWCWGEVQAQWVTVRAGMRGGLCFGLDPAPG